MQSSPQKRTHAHTKTIGWILGVLIFLGAIGTILSFVLPISEGNMRESFLPMGTVRTISVGDQEIRIEIADTPERRALGLSGRSGLVSGTGMLFVFPEPGLYSFWMKDMKFSIDILWFDEAGSLIHIQERVAPETFPGSFGPPIPAQFVLEIPAGDTDRFGFAVGTTFLKIP